MPPAAFFDDRSITLARREPPLDSADGMNCRCFDASTRADPARRYFDHSDRTRNVPGGPLGRRRCGPASDSVREAVVIDQFDLEFVHPIQADRYPSGRRAELDAFHKVNDVLDGVVRAPRVGKDPRVNPVGWIEVRRKHENWEPDPAIGH